MTALPDRGTQSCGRVSMQGWQKVVGGDKAHSTLVCQSGSFPGTPSHEGLWLMVEILSFSTHRVGKGS